MNPPNHSDPTTHAHAPAPGPGPRKIRGRIGGKIPLSRLFRTKSDLSDALGSGEGVGQDLPGLDFHNDDDPSWERIGTDQRILSLRGSSSLPPHSAVITTLVPNKTTPSSTLKRKPSLKDVLDKFTGRVDPVVRNKNGNGNGDGNGDKDKDEEGVRWDMLGPPDLGISGGSSDIGVAMGMGAVRRDQNQPSNPLLRPPSPSPGPGPGPLLLFDPHSNISSGDARARGPVRLTRPDREKNKEEGSWGKIIRKASFRRAGPGALAPAMAPAVAGTGTGIWTGTGTGSGGDGRRQGRAERRREREDRRDRKDRKDRRQREEGEERLAGQARETGGKEDEGIGRPVLISHDLHVTSSFKGLPPAWIERLREQGIGEREMEMIVSGRRGRVSVSSLDQVQGQGPGRGRGQAGVADGSGKGNLVRVRGKEELKFGPMERNWTGPPVPQLDNPTAQHARSSSENLLGTMFRGGLGLGMSKRSFSCLRLGTEEEGGEGDEHENSASRKDPSALFPNRVQPAQARRPLRARRRARTEDSPLLLNLSKGSKILASRQSAGLSASFTPVKSRNRARLSREVREFGQLKLSFEREREEGVRSADWAGDLIDLLRNDVGSEDQDGRGASTGERREMMRSISMDTGLTASIRGFGTDDSRDVPNACPSTRNEGSSHLTDGTTEASEYMQSPVEELDMDSILRQAPSIAPPDSPGYLFDGHNPRERTLSIGHHLPRTPTPPGWDNHLKGSPGSSFRRLPSSGTGMGMGMEMYGSFARASEAALASYSAVSPNMGSRIISLIPTSESHTHGQSEEGNCVMSDFSHRSEHRPDGSRFSRDSTTFEGPLSTSDGHDLSAIVQTAWYSNSLPFGALGNPVLPIQIKFSGESREQNGSMNQSCGR